MQCRLAHYTVPIENNYYKKYMNNRLSFLFLFLFAATMAAGQTLTGKVTDRQGSPVEFANIVLFSLPDSAFVTGAVSGADGNFRLSVQEHKGLLKVSSVGYATLYRGCKAGDTLDLILEADTRLLDEVVVKAICPRRA